MLYYDSTAESCSPPFQFLYLVPQKCQKMDQCRLLSCQMAKSEQKGIYSYLIDYRWLWFFITHIVNIVQLVYLLLNSRSKHGQQDLALIYQ